MILKGCLITLFLVMVHSQVARADSTQDQDKLLLFASETVLLEELDDARGRGGIVDNNMNLNANVAGIANNNVNGANTINSSFLQSSGINSVIQNSGNNVVIQNSTIMNVSVAP